MQNLFTNTLSQTISMPVIAFNVVTSFILGALISYIYKVTHRGISYSQSFIHTLVLLCMIVSVVMMTIGNNLARAFGLVGALSIIRFRTAVKDTKDTAYVFWVLATGMTIGTGNYSIAFVSCAIISLGAFVLSKGNFASIKKHDFILRFQFTKDKHSDKSLTDLFEEYLRYYHLVTLNLLKNTMYQYTYYIKFESDQSKDEFIKKLGDLKETDKIYLISAAHDVEL